MGQSLMITGTGFSTGKTLFSSILAKGLLSKGLKVGYLNIVEVGGHRKGYGAEYVRRVNTMHRAKLETFSLYSIGKNVSPHLGFEIEKRKFDWDWVQKKYYAMLEKNDLLIVDTPGTPLTPITPFLTNADLANDLDIPALLVIGNDLSAVHYGSMAAEVLFSRGISIEALVFNGYRPEDRIISKKNRDYLSEGLQLDILAEIPFQKGTNVRSLKFPDLYKSWHELLDSRVLRGLVRKSAKVEK